MLIRGFLIIFLRHEIAADVCPEDPFFRPFRQFFVFFRQIFDVENAGVYRIVGIIPANTVSSGEAEFSGDNCSSTSDFFPLKIFKNHKKVLNYLN